MARMNTTIFIDEHYTICAIEYVGYWQVKSHYRIQSTFRPNWFHRQMNRLLIGWKWIDA